MLNFYEKLQKEFSALNLYKILANTAQNIALFSTFNYYIQDQKFSMKIYMIYPIQLQKLLFLKCLQQIYDGIIS